MAGAKRDEVRAADVIKNWLRNRYTIEFLGTWEQIHNPNFKVVEFDHFRMQAGLPNFVLSVSEWLEKTNAIGLVVKKGRYGGTYAHKDIAYHFGNGFPEYRECSHTSVDFRRILETMGVETRKNQYIN